VASLQTRLGAEGELFCQRLHLFLEGCTTVPDGPGEAELEDRG
jgi:hypothetical protein